MMCRLGIIGFRRFELVGVVVDPIDKFSLIRTVAFTFDRNILKNGRETIYGANSVVDINIERSR